MSYHTFKDIVVKIKKSHLCWGCGIRVVPGFTMRYTASVFEKEFHQYYWCEICNEYIKSNSNCFDDGVAFSEFRGERHYLNFKNDLLFAKRIVLIEKVVVCLQ